MARIAVVGAGAWGTALAVVAARAGHDVSLWARDPEAVAVMVREGMNAARLPEIRLPSAIVPTGTLGEVTAADCIILSVPAQALRSVLERLPPVSAPLVVTAKGLERATGLRLSEVATSVCSGASVAALSGPSFAPEVARGLPTAVTIASERPGLSRSLAELLACPTFRPYPSEDLIGVELGGALKNVIAIAAGVTMGKGLGENARAALITRGLAEMTRIALALGARRETLMGLAGLGDLILTATSLTSRNTSFGHALARGGRVDELLARGRLSEGAYTAEAACRLGRAAGVELPIAEAVHAVVSGSLGIDAAIGGLLARPLAETE